MRVNPFVSLFAASLMAILPAHAFAQTTDQPEPVVRQEAVSVRDRDRPEYESEGRRLGGFVLNASLDLSVTDTDNLFAAESFEACDPPLPGETCPGELDDIIYSIAPTAHLESDWSRHMVALEAGADFVSHEDFSNEDRDTHYVRANGRFDIGDSTALRVSGRTAHQVTPRTDPDSPTDGNPVEYDRLDYSAGIDQRFARLGLHLDVGHSEYDYEGDQNDRNNEQDYIRGRADFELTPRIGLLLSANYDERDYTNLPLVDSDNVTYLAGVTVNSDLMRGEVSVGHFERDYADPAVGTIDGLAVAAELEWYITQLTTITFTARRDADDQISVDQRLPYETTEYGARVDHELLRNLILTASGRSGEREYDPLTRHDDYTELEAGADYFINRNAAVRFRYERDEVESTGVPASRDYEVNKYTVGLTLRL